MKKVISSYYCDIHSAEAGRLKHFDIVEEIDTRTLSIIATKKWADGKFRKIEYSISDFEYFFKINLADIL